VTWIAQFAAVVAAAHAVMLTLDLLGRQTSQKAGRSAKQRLVLLGSFDHLRQKNLVS